MEIANIFFVNQIYTSENMLLVCILLENIKISFWITFTNKFITAKHF